ncbi:MAG TPA: hypothetical protein VFX23_14965 [Limnobacter sp.]|uniref:hypothetical protein n=1 Tax=Limnobacter sp. TaxID=2003368 RepID=UPI002E341C1A|nr:hypothetical protein [Limnobacter sp.]HEX5487286.1 hypothetical protein [Limnobacter sp.]
MEHSGTSFVQMLPPTVVICLLLTAGFFFYTRYVRTAAALCSALQKISGTVRSMADGDEMIRKTGLSRVFQGTQFEFIWRDFSKTLHTQTNLVNGALRQRKSRLTVPVSYYFSTSAVIDRPLGVEYFKHLPGILTGIGIIGTFAGLLFGLSNFDASNAESMVKSISLLLGGVRDAFYASATAITAAMIITHWEKMVYRKCLAALDDLVEAIGSLFEAGVGEEYLAALVKQTSDSSDQAKSLKDELIQAMVPVIKQLESIQVDQANCIGQALEQALIEANRRLASQLETALVRQVKTPLEEMGKKMDARLSHIKSDPQDLARKVIRARMQDGHFESTPEAL